MWPKWLLSCSYNFGILILYGLKSLVQSISCMSMLPCLSCCSLFSSFAAAFAPPKSLLLLWNNSISVTWKMSSSLTGSSNGLFYVRIRSLQACEMTGHWFYLNVSSMQLVYCVSLMQVLSVCPGCWQNTKPTLLVWLNCVFRVLFFNSWLGTLLLNLLVEIALLLLRTLEASSFAWWAVMTLSR